LAPIPAIIDSCPYPEFLDPQNEKQLYEQLQASGMTFLSVGHRESLSNYHRSILDLTAAQTWSLKNSQSFTSNALVS
jgi:ABC-type uncharacterized transport system fused permease/ATPase subunit